VSITAIDYLNTDCSETTLLRSNIDGKQFDHVKRLLDGSFNSPKETSNKLYRVNITDEEEMIYFTTEIISDKNLEPIIEEIKRIIGEEV
jgi:hypothetical protein